MIDLDPTGKPMMNDEEIRIIDTFLSRIVRGKCLEWGSGNSTIYFTKRYPLLKWYSIEDNEEYANEVTKHVDPIQVSVLYTDDKKKYISGIDAGPFDFILIDGKYREECTASAMKLTKPHTIVLLHDAGREEYQTFIRTYSHAVLSKGELPTPSGWFMHRGLVQFYA